MNARSSRGFALAAASLAAGAAALLTAGCHSNAAGAATQPQPPAPAVSMAPFETAPSPSGSVSHAPPAAGLAGSLYYADGNRLVRLNGSKATTVLDTSAYSANVSPDGNSIAFVDMNADVVVADRDGKHRRTVLKGSVGAGFEPVWSPDSKRLLTVKNLGSGRVGFGIVAVASGTFTPLAHPLADAIHPLWSADGKHFGYATGECQLGVSDVDGGNAKVVPGYGGAGQRRSCDPYSISADGRYMSVNQRAGDQPDGDIGRDVIANAIVDTRTGANVSLPVTGKISAIVFLPNGEILVRTPGQLTLLNPDRTIKAQVDEPSGVRNARLLAYSAK
jgi:TolB protein